MNSIHSTRKELQKNNDAKKLIIRPNLYDYLKVIAIITMIIDHVGLIFYPEIQEFRIVWRTAFPIFLFLVWYNHSFRRRNSLRYRGIWFQILLRWGYFLWNTNITYLNILLAIWAVRVILSYLQPYKKIILETVIFLLACWAAWYTFTYIDYGTLSLTFGLLWYRARQYTKSIFLSWIIIASIIYHLFFMVTTRGYDPSFLMVSIGLILCIALLRMQKSNTSLRTQSIPFNQSILFISQNALPIYVAQALILGSISFFS